MTINLSLISNRRKFIVLCTLLVATDAAAVGGRVPASNPDAIVSPRNFRAALGVGRTDIGGGISGIIGTSQVGGT